MSEKLQAEAMKLLVDRREEWMRIAIVPPNTVNASCGAERAKILEDHAAQLIQAVAEYREAKAELDRLWPDSDDIPF